jgi:sarcosine oxidase subunit delta
MHLFPCPLCGPRDETEFHYDGELGNLRPGPAEAVSAPRWAAYLYERDNVRGLRREIWSHQGGCGLFFGMERNAVSHEVVRSFRLDGHGEASR